MTYDSKQVADDVSVLSKLSAALDEANASYQAQETMGQWVPRVAHVPIEWTELDETAAAVGRLCAALGERGLLAGGGAESGSVDREYDENNECTECGEHIADPHAPQCSRGD